MRLPVRILACLTCVFLVSGCHKHSDTPATGARPVGELSNDLPSYLKLAAIHNDRVTQLEKFRANRVIVGMWYKDADGQAQQDHVEGSLRFKRPNDVYLYLQKAGAVDVAILGSNTDKYWWLNLLEDKQALVGEHVRFTPDRVGRFAMPVHPLDLLDLLAITQVPSYPARTHVVHRDASRNAVVMTVPSKFGFRDILFSPGDYQPIGVAIYDMMGHEIARSVLGEPVSVDIAMVLEKDQPRVASSAEITFAGSDARAKLTIYSPTTRSWDRRQDRAFDVDYLIEKYSIRDVVNLDETPVEAIRVPLPSEFGSGL
ncbi:MAG: hypothetical protein H6815_08725 [Phycisphaeraceae bacterium]|nr:hypothetical protein [Phycisphaerales bacterium]MCB9860526.1 hypothetical protein [Phycisphaeraceae bacterium]